MPLTSAEINSGMLLHGWEVKDKREVAFENWIEKLEDWGYTKSDEQMTKSEFVWLMKELQRELRGNK